MVLHVTWQRHLNAFLFTANAAPIVEGNVQSKSGSGRLSSALHALADVSGDTLGVVELCECVQEVSCTVFSKQKCALVVASECDLNRLQ